MGLFQRSESNTNVNERPANSTKRDDFYGVPADVVLSMATAPVLFALWGGKVVTTLLQEMGQASEEVFRGDRLPVLNFPATTHSTPENSNSPQTR
jgi:hypothetical protein